MAAIIDGKLISAEIRQEIKEEVNLLKEQNIVPGLAVVIVGDDPASKVYVRNKQKACGEVGIYSEVIELPQATSQEELLGVVSRLNKRKDIHGILVQLPLPEQIDEIAVTEYISKEKDVDAFSDENVGKIMKGSPKFLPCTPAGVMELMRRYKIDVCGKNCCVIGRSNIVGKPLAMMLLTENGTVTVCHSKTKNIAEITQQADILVSAVGKEAFVTKEMVKPGAVVIDVGINRNAAGKLCGDVKFDEVSEAASYITPVPGGVGPMTITMLLKNTVTAARLQNNL